MQPTTSLTRHHRRLRARQAVRAAQRALEAGVGRMTLELQLPLIGATDLVRPACCAALLRPACCLRASPPA